jgi:ATP-dependent Clp protease ATP-binding subunit ClpC
MFDRFSSRAKKTMVFARQEAQRLNHEYIGTEHMLLGLLRVDTGVAASVLENMSVDVEEIRHEVHKIAKIGPSMVTMGMLPFTPRAKKALELAMVEATELRHDYIGTEHLLLGLIGEREGIAAHALANLGIELDRVRAEVLEFGCGSRIEESDLSAHEHWCSPRWCAQVFVEKVLVQACAPPYRMQDAVQASWEGRRTRVRPREGAS